MPKRFSPLSGNSDPSLFRLALDVLEAGEPDTKVAAAKAAADAWRSGSVPVRAPGDALSAIPKRPARPARPELLPPTKMPRRRGGGAGRIALIHALAHIEFNAIDLAFDLIARAAFADLPRAFFDDWVTVGADEARHFALLQRRLGDLDSHYGALPAHDGLWESAEATAGDLKARLAVVPMVLEARGLDVTPQTIEHCERRGDIESAAILQTILSDEITHVRAGTRWFDHLCREENSDPVGTFHALVRHYFRGFIKPPYNAEARKQAHLPPEFYEPLAPDNADSA